MTESWDRRYLGLAKFIAEKWSKDPSTKVGSVIVGTTNEVISLGFNGFPRGVDDNVPERWERPLKYQYCVHGEANAIFNCARHGACTMASTLYLASLPDRFSPCDKCCQAIIQAGICRVVYEQPLSTVERWAGSFEVGLGMLREAGVEVDMVALPCEHVQVLSITEDTKICFECKEKV